MLVEPPGEGYVCRRLPTRPSWRLETARSVESRSRRIPINREHTDDLFRRAWSLTGRVRAHQGRLPLRFGPAPIGPREQSLLGWNKRIRKDAIATFNYLRLKPLEEGLAITLLRACWMPFVLYHWVVFDLPIWVVGWVFLRSDRLKVWTEENLDDLFYLLVDIYVATWTLGVVVAYSVCYHETVRWVRPGFGSSLFWIEVAGVVSLLRLYEIWSFMGCLHSQRAHASHYRVRAIINTFWHYGEVIVCFATLYLVIACLWSDPFTSAAATAVSGRAIASDWVSPLYFSAITIATVGFGDLSPQSFQGRAAVVAEVLFGLFLFIVVLQQAISSKEDRSGTDDRGSISY